MTEEKQRDSPSRLPDPATWVDQHGDFLFRFALSRLGNRAVAEDLVQDTFVAALRAVQNFSGRSAERTWFVGILKHKIVDFLRQQVREQPVSVLNPSGERSEQLFDTNGWWQVKPGKWPADPGEVLEKKEFWKVFRHCLESLPPRLRAVFTLREMDELPTGEVCEALSSRPRFTREEDSMAITSEHTREQGLTCYSLEGKPTCCKGPSVSRSILGGFAGTLAITMMMYLVAPMMLGHPMDIAKMLGSMLGGQWWAGMALHFVNGTLIFPLIYSFLLFGLLPGSPAVKGITWGVVLWLVAQVVVMPMMGAGFFSGSVMAAMGSLIGHVAYGWLLGWVAGSPK